MIACRTLGGWDLIVGDGPPPADLKWKKNFALLVYLARSPARGRARDHLIGLLWGDKPDGAARGSLNEALRTLRKHLGQGSLGAETEPVRLNPGYVDLDVARFEALAKLGDLKGAVELIGGNGVFLADFTVPDAPGFEEWVLAERARLCPHCANVLTKRGEELLDRGREREAADHAIRALALDELHEPAVRLLMRALARLGDRAGALRAYEEFNARWAERMGATPDKETEALAQRLRAGGEPSWPARPTPSPAPKSEPAQRAPLEDRMEALERLLTAWRACRDERRRVVMIIEGDPGMGKTRLADELATRARVDGAVVIAIRAVEADLTSPWSGALALCRGGLPAAPGATGASPDALKLLSSPLGSPLLGQAFAEVVEAVCHEQPLMLVLDDAQWLDRESLLAVLAMLRDASPAPLAVVFTTQRPLRAELDEVGARVGREVTGGVARLGPLSSEAILRMTQWALPISDGDQIARIARRVAADSAGIPLLAVALLEAVALGLTLDTTREGWLASGHTLDQTLPGDLPDNVVKAIRVMFGRVSGDGQAVLLAAAVLGRVPVPKLGAGAGLTGPRLAAALDELEWKLWLVADPLGYTFVARIVRDVIDRDMVTEGQRRRIREAAGE